LGSRLITIRTNLSDYAAPQYGYDRRGAGPRKTNASGQPYVLKDLPQKTFTTADYNAQVGPVPFEDFLLRGGQLLPQNTARDLDRLGKMFTDLKSPNGLLFTAKQEVLSKSAVNVLAGANQTDNPKFDNKRPLNNGLYLPTSTLAQAGVNALGFHLLKQGLNPFAETDGSNQDPTGNPVYFETAASSERTGQFQTPQSRLVDFAINQVNSNTNGILELYSYSGGPGANLGIGNTNVNMISDQRTGRNEITLGSSRFFDTEATGFFNYSIFSNPRSFNFEGSRYFNGKGASQIYGQIEGNSSLLLSPTGTFKITNDTINGSFISQVGQSVYQTGSFQNNRSVKGLGTTTDYKTTMTLGTENVVTDNNLYNEPTTQDFRTKTPVSSSKSLDYTDANLRFEGRVNLGDPGRQFDRVSYTEGRGVALDGINAYSLYKAKSAKPDTELNDFCKFRIGVIDNDNPSLKTYIHFRAFLDGMSDNYNAEWEATQLAGRGEQFYNYKGFDRSISLSWTVVAQSKQELIPMYQKLNYLSSVLAPDYSKNGYMRGNLVELTVGGYLYNQIGFINSITYDVPEESPWEIAISDSNTSRSGRSFADQDVKELPHMIKVSGFEFTPIQSFIPEIQKNTFSNLDGDKVTTLGKISTFGKQRYISLSNGITENYLPSGKGQKIKQRTDSTQQSNNASQNGGGY